MGALGQLDIIVTQLHSEAAPNQFEIVTSHAPAFEVFPTHALPALVGRLL